MKKGNSLSKLNSNFNFWFCAGLLVVLLTSTLARDITRPFYGLHSWAEAHGAWLARTHVKYGLGYTKGLLTWAVGDPPAANPKHYLDHPQFPALLDAPIIALLGAGEWQYRVTRIITSIASLLLFLKLIKNLLGEKVALLSGLFFVLFPLISYFGVAGWLTPVTLLGMWCYHVLIGSFGKSQEPKRCHKWILAISLFLAVQISWSGFFYAMAFGVHYVARCIFRRQMPDKSILAILIIVALSSLILNFIIMASGYGWDLQKIVELYRWRSAKGEMQQFQWGAWLAKFWEFAVTNFTLPVLITTIIYLAFGQLFVLASNGPSSKRITVSRCFPHFWFFVLPGIFQLFLLKGCLWKHQTWEMPLWPVFAIATALGVIVLRDVLKKLSHHIANTCTVALMIVIIGFCLTGTNYYYAVRWQPQAKIKMFKMLNEKTLPSKALLSFESFTVNQHESKGVFYRPEIAWYLDREIEPAQNISDIENKAATGQYPFYLLPTIGHNKQTTLHLRRLLSELEKRYKLFTYVPGQPFKKTKDGKFLEAGMPAYMIFDLRSRVGSD